MRAEGPKERPTLHSSSSTVFGIQKLTCPHFICGNLPILPTPPTNLSTIPSNCAILSSMASMLRVHTVSKMTVSEQVTCMSVLFNTRTYCVLPHGGVSAPPCCCLLYYYLYTNCIFNTSTVYIPCSCAWRSVCCMEECPCSSTGVTANKINLFSTPL